MIIFTIIIGIYGLSGVVIPNPTLIQNYSSALEKYFLIIADVVWYTQASTLLKMSKIFQAVFNVRCGTLYAWVNEKTRTTMGRV